MRDPTKILIIFDLDFTLIDNSFTICNSFIHALELFKVPPPEKARIIQKIGVPLKDMFLDYLDEPNAKKAVQLFRDYYSVHFFEGVELIPGAIALLKELKEQGYRLALLTSKKTDLAIKLMDRIDLKQYFEFILGEQPEFKPKPDPASIFHIMARFPETNRAYMVGDHIVDCMAAQNSSIKFIGVLTGITSEKEFRNYADKDTIILESVKDILPSSHFK